jgi:hypothetical protein
MGVPSRCLMDWMSASPHSGWSQSISTASGRSCLIASSTLSDLSMNFGWNPWSSTIKPNSAATTSSRARIRTLRTQVGQEELSTPGNLWTCGFSGGGLETPRYFRNRCPLLSIHLVRGVENPCRGACELTFGKHNKGAANRANRAAQKTRRSNAGALGATPKSGAGCT